MPRSTTKVHYANLAGYPVCGSLDKHPATARPTQVTCTRCRATRAYREMMDPAS